MFFSTMTEPIAKCSFHVKLRCKISKGIMGQKGGGAFVAKRDIFAQKGWKRENAKWIACIKTMQI